MFNWQRERKELNKKIKNKNKKKIFQIYLRHESFLQFTQSQSLSYHA